MKNQINAQILIRISISLLFLWFGLNQIFDPNSFMGYLPNFALSFASQAILFNGIVEVILGTLLLLGIFTRIVSLILSLHLLFITLTLGYNDIAVRDFILTIVTFSIFLSGYDEWCLMKKY